MLLVFMEAAFFVVSLIFIIIGKRKVKAVIDVPITITETNKENMIKIMIENPWIFPIVRMKAFVVVIDTLTSRKNKRWMKLADITKGKTSFVHNVTFQKAGNYRIELKTIRIYDITGLMYGTIKVHDSGNIQVLPTIHEVIVRLSAAVKNFYGETEVYDEHKPGQDNSELFDVREYRAGDRLQNIHWKMTAKQDELMVKEHGLPKACPVVLILDFNQGKYVKNNRYTVGFLEIVASLSFSIMDAGCPHYVAWYDEDVKDIIRVRVDDEESLFYFISVLMNVRWCKTEENIMERYKEKYKAELYVWLLSLNEGLELKKGEELLTVISEEHIEEELQQIELLL